MLKTRPSELTRTNFVEQPFLDRIVQGVEAESMLPVKMTGRSLRVGRYVCSQCS
jgi:hypothetical protein